MVKINKINSNNNNSLVSAFHERQRNPESIFFSGFLQKDMHGQKNVMYKISLMDILYVAQMLSHCLNQ